MIKKVPILWLSKPEGHDYTAAMSYLSLIYDKKKATACANQLKRVLMTEFKAKDIFRASSLPLLGIVNSHVLENKKKILAILFCYICIHMEEKYQRNNHKKD